MSDAERVKLEPGEPPDPDVVSPLASALHDAIDEQEDLREEAREAVREAREHLLDLVDDLGDTEAAMEAVALLVEQRLSGKNGLMRKSMRAGFGAGRKRRADLK